MPSKLSGPTTLFAQDLFVSQAGKVHELGTIGLTSDGRIFRYCLAGGTSLVAGRLQQAPAEVTNHQNLTPTAAAAIGATEITVTLGATLATANQYAEGLLMVTTSTGVGYAYRIKSHPAAASAATLLVTLEDALQVATTTTSRIDLVLNPFSGVLIGPVTETSCIVGVANDVIVNAEYGWIQTGGPACVLADGTVTVGTQLVAATASVTGAVKPVSTDVVQHVGRAITGIADTEYGAVWLNLE